MFWRGMLRSRNARDPADHVFGAGHSPDGCYLFDDGMFGRITDSEFDIAEFLDDDDWEAAGLIEGYYRGAYGGKLKEEAERLIRERFGGMVPVGNIYIDRWDMDGNYHQGGCFLCFEGETLRDYCDRNGEPYPVREIPEEVIEAFEAGDYGTLRGLGREVPELRGV